jgi:hypothetical protein
MLLLFLALCPQDSPLESVQKSLAKTAESSYAYKVTGRFERSGEWVPPGLLTARIDAFDSARNGMALLVKGPDGLWKTPGERMGELVEKPDKVTGDMIKTLEEAEPPHVMVADLVRLADKATKGDDIVLDGTKCARYTLTFSKELLKAFLEKQMAKSIERGTIAKPDAVKWSTLEGSLRVYVDRQDGFLAKVIDKRSVKTEYKRSGAADVKVYENEFEFDFNGWGKATASLPVEVKEKLGIKEEKK